MSVSIYLFIVICGMFICLVFIDFYRLLFIIYLFNFFELEVFVFEFLWLDC